MLDLAEVPDLTSPGRLMAHVTYLDGMLGQFAEAVGDLGITLKALGAEASGKVKWSQVRHNTLRIGTEVTFAEGSYKIAYRPGEMELEGPIENEDYREWLSQQIRGKALGEITPLIRLEIEADVLGETVTLAGANGVLSRHSAIPNEAAEAIARGMSRPGEETAPDEKSTARALWRSHLRYVEVPAAHTFD
jgi:hypothetical protein